MIRSLRRRGENKHNRKGWGKATAALQWLSCAISTMLKGKEIHELDLHSFSVLLTFFTFKLMLSPKLLSRIFL